MVIGTCKQPEKDSASNSDVTVWPVNNPRQIQNGDSDTFTWTCKQPKKDSTRIVI